MPSPIAHSALMLAAWPAVKMRTDPQLPPGRRVLLWLAVLGALNAPDADILLGPVFGARIMAYHNTFSHSLLATVVFAVLFAFIAGWIAGRGWGMFFCAGLLCYGSHVFLDALTWGPGIQLFWPFTEERFRAPFYLFWGVRHSAKFPWYYHVITVLNDLAFTAIVWGVTRVKASRAS